MLKNISLVVAILTLFSFFYFTMDKDHSSKTEGKEDNILKKAEKKESVKIEYEDEQKLKKLIDNKSLSTKTSEQSSSPILKIVDALKREKEKKRQFLKAQERRFQEFQRRVAYENHMKKSVLANAMLKSRGKNGFKDSFHKTRFVRLNSLNQKGAKMAIIKDNLDRTKGISLMIKENQAITKREQIKAQIKRGGNYEE